MKVYVDYLTKEVKIVKDEKWYKSTKLTSRLFVYVKDNLEDTENENYSVSVEFLRSDGRNIAIYTKDSVELDDGYYTDTETNENYFVHRFTLTDSVLKCSGTVAITGYINIKDDDANVIKVGHLFNAVDVIEKTVEYSNGDFFCSVSGEDSAETLHSFVEQFVTLRTSLNTLENKVTRSINSKADKTGSATTNFKVKDLELYGLVKFLTSGKIYLNESTYIDVSNNQIKIAAGSSIILFNKDGSAIHTTGKIKASVDTPVASNDIVNKSYVDDKVSNLTQLVNTFLESDISAFITEVNQLKENFNAFMTGTSADNVINTLAEIRQAIQSNATGLNNVYTKSQADAKIRQIIDETFADVSEEEF